LAIEEQKHQLYMTKLNFDLSQKGIYVGLNYQSNENATAKACC
jgi:hypothetical protein